MGAVWASRFYGPDPRDPRLSGLMGGWGGIGGRPGDSTGQGVLTQIPHLTHSATWGESVPTQDPLPTDRVRGREVMALRISLQPRDSQAGATLPPKGHLAVSEDSFGHSHYDLAGGGCATGT